MPTKLVNHIKAHYTPDDIKALIVADMRSRGFADIVAADLDDEENARLGSVKPFVDGPVPFNGFYIDKEIPVKPPHNSRGPG